MNFLKIKTKYHFESVVCVFVYPSFHLFFNILSDLPNLSILHTDEYISRSISIFKQFSLA